jgi:hypothetical protein
VTKQIQATCIGKEEVSEGKRMPWTTQIWETQTLFHVEGWLTAANPARLGGRRASDTTSTLMTRMMPKLGARLGIGTEKQVTNEPNSHQED